MADVIMFQNNLSPSVSDTIMVGGVAFNLTGSSVKFCMRLRTSSTLKVNATATIVSPTAGTVRYDWAGSDTDTSGEYVGYWSATLPSGDIQDTPEFAVYIQAHSLSSTVNNALCSVEDVRELLEISQTVDRSRDQLIGSLIARASEMILTFCDRQFAPQETNTTHTFAAERDFTGDEHVIDLAPYDVRTGPNGTTNPTVVMNPEDGANQITLTPITDFTFEPVLKPEGVYKRIRISQYRYIWSNFLANYGYAQIAITADWGFPSVPIDVNNACARTVATWLSPRAASYGTDDILGGDPRSVLPLGAGTWDIPRGVQSNLKRYRRSVM